MDELILLTHVPSDSVNRGFLPAAKRLGMPVILLTDHAEAHRRHFGEHDLPAYPEAIVACDVFNPIAVIDTVARRRSRPAAVFSNSDHLQTSTALAASYFRVPGKDWKSTYRTKNKAQMRAHLRAENLDDLRHSIATDPSDLANGIRFPSVVKPREGVASQHVKLVRDATELERHCRTIWAEQRGLPLLIEDFIDGPLLTLETLGDGRQITVLGGFRVQLSPPPHFIELEAEWTTEIPPAQTVLDQLAVLGVGFGSCHSEFVLTEDGPRLIEVNYRSIGDGRDFLIEQVSGMSFFELILRLHLGESLPSIPITSKSALIRYFPANTSGLILKIPEPYRYASEDAELIFRPLRKPGDEITVSYSNKDYLGALSGVGTDPESVRRAVTRAADDLRWEIGR